MTHGLLARQHHAHQHHARDRRAVLLLLLLLLLLVRSAQRGTQAGVARCWDGSAASDMVRGAGTAPELLTGQHLHHHRAHAVRVLLLLPQLLVWVLGAGGLATPGRVCLRYPCRACFADLTRTPCCVCVCVCVSVAACTIVLLE